MKCPGFIRNWFSKHPKLEKFAKGVQKRRKRLVTGFVLFAHIIGALTSVKAIMETRTAQGAVAWAISLNTMPYVAVPAYWVFGRSDFSGYVTARRDHRENFEEFWQTFEKRLVEQDLIWDPDREVPFVSETLAKLPATGKNDVQLLVDGDETFDSIFEGISKAEDYVLVQFYIIQEDEVGFQLRDAMLERAQAGVRCLLLYDEVGTKLSKEFLQPLWDAGVDARPFNTTQGDSNRFQLNFRNHRKIVVVDGDAAWVGGLNVGKEYKGLDPKFGYWRDTHLKMEGPIVQCVQVAFAEDWHWAAKQILEDLNWEPKPASSGANKGMLCVPTGPVDEMESCTLFFLHAINTAQKRLWIASPYFVPDEQFVSALQLAALRGVDVRILVPDVADSAMVNLSAWSYVPELHAADIEVYRYTNGFMHHKVVLIDDRYATIGTANFDNRSFRLNFEITMGVDDESFASEVEKMLEEDFSNSRLVEHGELDEKSSWYRFWVQVARLAAPVQ